MFPRPNEPYYILERPDISSSFFPFSPPILHHDGLHDLFIAAATTANNLPPPPPAPAAVSEKTVLSGGAPPLTGRRRTVRKDRHSKIYTAQGPRDRRMRLSLDVARKFFDLQDLLGFDKASKTVQWLLNMSKAAIKELVSASKSEFSTSECDEDISTISDNKGKPLPPVPQQAVLASEESNTKTKRAVGGRPLRSRPLVQPKVARESRVKARARARERTLEKKMMQCGKQEGGTQGNQKPMVLQAIPFGSFQEESSSHDLKSSLELVTEMEENCSTSPIYRKETDNNGSGSIAVSDYNQTVASLFQEPWDMIFTGSIDERIMLSDLPLQTYYGRPNTTSN